VLPLVIAKGAGSLLFQINMVIGVNSGWDLGFYR